jgi:NMD protein affecting ribosome stability and mRNA decay
MKDKGIDLVVISVQSAARDVVSVNAGGQYDAKYSMNTQLLDSLVAAGMTVVVIRDVPFPPDDVIDCVTAFADDLAQCDGSRDERVVADPLYDAAVGLDDTRVQVVDFTDAICDETTCFDVVGGVIVYFNQGHLTATFAQTLRPWLEEAITGLLGD